MQVHATTPSSSAHRRLITPNKWNEPTYNLTAAASQLTIVPEKSNTNNTNTAISPMSESDKLKHKLEQAKASAQQPLRVTDAELAVIMLRESFIAAQASSPLTVCTCACRRLRLL